MTTNALASSNVVAINPKGDDALPNDRHATERAEILGAIDTAEDLLGGAMLEGLRMTVVHGATSKGEVAANYTRCNNPAVYSSWFNLGDKAQAIIGQKAALKLIDDAAKGKGAGFNKAKAALGAVIKTAKESGAKELKPAQAKAAVAAALTAAQAPKVSVPKIRGVKVQDAATMAAAALECGKGHREMAAFLLLCSQNGHRLPVPAGREDLHRKALLALADCAEIWQGFKA
jgi:hypothetical protein